MPACASCGSTNLKDDACLDCGAGLDAEARIAAWLEVSHESHATTTAGPGPACTACGYEGEMIVDAHRGGTTCPACLVVIPARRTEAASKVARVVECPECGRSIGLVKEDEGKTVVCPGCSYFLGTFATGSAWRGDR